MGKIWGVGLNQQALYLNIPLIPNPTHLPPLIVLAFGLILTLGLVLRHGKGYYGQTPIGMIGIKSICELANQIM